MDNPNDTSRRRDPFEELNRKVEQAMEEVRPKLRRAFEELEQRVDAAVEELRPRVDEARSRARPKVDEFVADFQPRVDSVLSRMQSALDSLRRDLDTRANRAEARRAGAAPGAADAPWPEDEDGAQKAADPPKEDTPEWPTRDGREYTSGEEDRGGPTGV